MKNNENYFRTKELEFYREKYEKSFAEDKASIDNMFALKLESKQNSYKNIPKSKFNPNSPELNLLFKQKNELLIEENLSSQAKQHQKELEELDETIVNLEKELKNIDICDKVKSFPLLKAEKDNLLQVYEKNLQIKLQEMEQINEKHILTEQSFQMQKFKKNFENLEEIMQKEGFPAEEDEKLRIAFENEQVFRLNEFIQLNEQIWVNKKYEIDEKIGNFYKKKQLELKKELNDLLKIEMDIWEEEKNEKKKNLNKYLDLKENKDNNHTHLQNLDYEIENLEKYKSEFEDFRNKKQQYFEEIQERQNELREAYKMKTDTIRGINRIYKELEIKQNNNLNSSQNLKQLINEKSLILESMKSKKVYEEEKSRNYYDQEDSKIYFTSNNTDSSIEEPVLTGKFREKTTNSKESINKLKKTELTEKEDEIIEFSSNNDDEIDFNLSSDEKSDHND